VSFAFTEAAFSPPMRTRIFSAPADSFFQFWIGELVKYGGLRQQHGAFHFRVSPADGRLPGPVGR